MNIHHSWGNIPKVQQTCLDQTWRSQTLPGVKTLLPFGQGRSYGDVCLNDQGYSLATGRLNRFIHFDREQGILSAEAGITLAEILQLTLPAGWFLPVTPGTKFVSLGGAIANDVHGKNHHKAGSFGRHVRAFELLRSDGQKLICTAEENSDWFSATIGGLGLTGLITQAELQLKKIDSPAIVQKTRRFENLAEFLRLSEETEADWEYTVAWVDCMAKGKQLGRGIFSMGNHATAATPGIKPEVLQPKFSMPFNAPGWLLNQYSVQLFNQLYYHLPRKRDSTVHYEPFFYPLDKIANWNRLYGKRGFYQFQCVVPLDKAEAAIEEMLQHISKSGQGSFLSVLKRLSNIASPGMLSFPRDGITLALDFANRGESTRHLLADLNEITDRHGGAIYPAKDATMTNASFINAYPGWQKFSEYMDPHFSSSFWRRVTGE
jgi:FAD/FMN-containing dehydrogenase